MDIVETLMFMSQYPNTDKLLYQYFDDSGSGRKELTGFPKRLSEESLQHLKEMNKKGAGIFFTVNGFDEEDRKKEKVRHINAWICEIDGVDKKFQKQLIELCPLKPSLVIESKNSYHMYRFAKDGTIENWEKICNGLRNFFDGDPNVITLERVLRLPGFEHCKNENDRFTIVVDDYTGATYTEQEMMKMYPNFKTVAEKKKEKKKIEKQLMQDDGDFWHRVSQFDCNIMLPLLSGTQYVRGEQIELIENTNGTKQIFIDGKSTSCWIDNHGFIGSKDGGGPTWIQWVTWYGSVDWKDLYRFLIDKFPELKEQKDKHKTPQEREIDDFFVGYNRNFVIDTTTPIPFTWGLPKLDAEFGKIEKGRFMTTLGESGSGKTTRAFFQGIQISKEYKVLFVSLEMQAERVIELRARKQAGITIDERNTKNIPEHKLLWMQSNKSEITSNKKLEIVGVNKKAESIHVDMIVKSLLKNYMDFDFVIIDNLGFIAGEGANFYLELGYIVRQLKNFCHDYGKNVNLLHHFNKGKGDRRNRTFADALGTGKLEHDVDYGLIVHRCLDQEENVTPEERSEVFLKLAKNRDNGLVKKETVYFYKGEYHEVFNFSQ